MTHNDPAAAAAARESHRQPTGQFGTQPRAEAELEFPIPSGSEAVDALLDARDGSLRAVDAATTPQEDRDVSALLQRQSAKLAGLGVPVDFPGAAKLELVQDHVNHGYKVHQVLGADGTVLADEAAIADYDHYVGRGFGGLAQVTYADVADSFVIDHDSWIDDVAEVTAPSRREHAAIVIDLAAAAQMDALASTVVTEPEQIAHQEQVRAARAQRQRGQVETVEPLVQSTRATVDLIARVHPSAVRAEVTFQHEAFEEDTLSLYDAAGRCVREHDFDGHSLLSDLDQEGLEMEDWAEPEYNGFESTGYVIDLAAVRAGMEPRL